jgi:hypothetical protein
LLFAFTVNCWSVRFCSEEAFGKARGPADGAIIKEFSLSRGLRGLRVFYPDSGGLKKKKIKKH